MAVPKRRQSKARKRKRRSHDSLTLPTYTYCSNCNSPIMPHSICDNCGYYKDKEVIKIKVKEEKKKKKEEE